jgi:2-dehydropantoate 2-reductase
LTPQNGVATEELLGQLFGREKIIAGTVLNPISIPEVGTVRLEMRKGGLGLAPIDPACPSGPVVDAIASIGLPLRVYANYRAMKWSKLLLNLLGNATSAILDMNTLDAFADRRVFAIEVAALREAIAVMDALNIKAVTLPGYPVTWLVFAIRYLPLAILQPIMRRMAKSGRGEKLPSLLIDLNAGRPKSEIDALNGAVSEASQSIGVKTPARSSIAWAALSRRSSRKRAPISCTPWGRPSSQPTGTAHEGNPRILTGTTIRMALAISPIRETSSSMRHGRSQHTGESTIG